MNKKVLFGLFGLAAGSLMADEVATFSPYVAAKGGYTILSKRDGIKYKNGFNGAVEFGISYAEWRVALEVAYHQNKIDAANANVKLNALSGMINVYYDYALTDECSLYAGAGLGVAKIALKDSVINRESYARTVMAWQLMAGVAYDINENWTATAGYCLFNTTKAKNMVENNNVKMPFAHCLELGLRYNF